MRPDFALKRHIYGFIPCSSKVGGEIGDACVSTRLFLMVFQMIRNFTEQGEGLGMAAGMGGPDRVRVGYE